MIFWSFMVILCIFWNLTDLLFMNCQCTEKSFVNISSNIPFFPIEKIACTLGTTWGWVHHDNFKFWINYYFKDNMKHHSQDFTFAMWHILSQTMFCEKRENVGKVLILSLCLYHFALLCSLGRKYLHFDYDNNTKYYENKS